MNLNGNITGKYLPLIPTKGSFNYLTMNTFTTYNKEAKYIRSHDYIVYDLEGKEVKPYLQFDFGVNNAPEDFIQNCKSNKEFREVLRNDKYVHSIISYFETEEYIYLYVILGIKSYSIYLNKKTKEIKKYNHKNLHDLFVQIMPVASIDSKFYNIYYPHYKLSKEINYKFRLQYSKEKVGKKDYDLFQDIYNISIDENPVIVITSPNF